MTSWTGAIPIIMAFGLLSAGLVWQAHTRLRREAFIREFQWPPGLLDKLTEHHPAFSRKESALVGSGLRQFFLAYLRGGRRHVAMPSQVADDLWHEFILYTRDYKEFCKKAFGTFLHHTPAVRLAPQQRSSNEGLRRVWYHSCKAENINPLYPTRLPLLFALDTKFNIPGGYRYTPDCTALQAGGVGGGRVAEISQIQALMAESLVLAMVTVEATEGEMAAAVVVAEIELFIKHKVPPFSLPSPALNPRPCFRPFFPPYTPNFDHPAGG